MVACIPKSYQVDQNFRKLPYEMVNWIKEI